MQVISIRRPLDQNLGKNGLRFGIMCRGYEFQAWQANAITELLSNGHHLELIILDENPEVHLSIVRKILLYPWRRFLYRFCLRYLFKPPAKATTSLKHDLDHLPVVRCRTMNKSYSQYFVSSDIAIIRSYHLDFILRFGFNIIRGDILDVAAYGIWSFHHGDERKYRGGPPGFWEIYSGDRVCGAVLQRLTDALDAGIIIYRGTFKTISHSYTATLNRLLTGTSGWPNSVASAISRAKAEGNPDMAIPSLLNWMTSDTQALVYRAPGNSKMIKALMQLFFNRIVFHYNDLTRAEKWNIAITKGTVNDVIQGEHHFNPLWLPAPPKCIYYADPFVVEKESMLHIYCEEYDYHKSKGTLVRMIIDPATAGILSKTTVLSESFHLSYPFLVAHDGRLYCIPESASTGKIAVYRVDEEEGTFVPYACLLENVDAVDPTLFYYQGLWWLMFTGKQLSDTCLYAYYSTEPFAGYRPHHNNPVKTDVRSSRPAGTPFIYNRELFRPAQDCSATYGGEVVVNKIIRLTPGEFVEEVYGVIRSLRGRRRKEKGSGDKNSMTTQDHGKKMTMVTMGESFFKGLHTVNFAGEHIIFDGKRYVCDRYAFRKRLKQKIINLFG